MGFTLLIVAMGNVATVRAVLPTLPCIAHEMLATVGADVFHLGIAVEQIAMGIPPNHTALVRAETSMSMS